MLWVSHRHVSKHESIERMFPDHLHVLKMLDSNVLIYGLKVLEKDVLFKSTSMESLIVAPGLALRTTV